MRQLLLLAALSVGSLLSHLHAQQLAFAGRGPRFLSAPKEGAALVEIDASRNAALRQSVSLAARYATVGSVLRAIEAQTGLKFVYSRTVIPVDRRVGLRADSITVAAALTEVLLDANVDVVLARDGQFTLVRRVASQATEQMGTVVGRVNDAKTGTNISGVDVSLDGTRWRTTTDANGSYRLAEVAPGSYTVLARRIGYAPERRAVTVTAGQEATADVALQAAATRLSDVVVTAQKREERLQDVPLSIAVVTPEEIDRRGLVSGEDYLRGIPGVNQVSQGGAASGSVIIRGLETAPSFQNFWTGTAVATYFGETPTTSSAGLAGNANVDALLVDIERVEVLRGPQGTAFGNSSLGGAVRTIPVAPKLDRFEGKVASSYSVTSGNGGDNYMIQGVANLPLIKDKLALRATGYWSEESGFYRSAAGSDPAFQSTFVAPWGAQAFATDGDDVGSSNSTAGRIAALFQPSDNLKFTLTYLKQKGEADDQLAASAGTYEQTFLEVAPEHVVRGQRRGVWDSDMDLANAMLEYDFGWANLLATYSYVKSGTIYSSPFTASGIPLPVSQFGTSEHRAHSGEIRLTTQLDGAWNFLAGLYAEDLDDEDSWDYYWTASPESQSAIGFGTERFLGAFLGQRNLTQKAAFAEASWRFLPGFTLTGGVRAYDYDRTLGGSSIAGVFAGAGGAAPEFGSEASGTSFRANLSHKLNDNALVYASWAQGFRLGRPTGPGASSGGVCDLDNDGILDGTSFTLDQTRRLDPDEVDNYELGGKFTLLDRRLLIAADVYRVDWTGLPVTQVASCEFAFTVNAGVARSEGIEFQANFYITEAFRVDVGGSYVRATLTQDAPGLGPAGARLPGSPEVNANLGLQYEFKLGGSEAFVRADPIYVGSYYGNLAESMNTKAGGYVKVDASARVALRYLDVGLFVRNLTNADDFTFRGIGLRDQGEFYGFRLRPRTIGLQLSRNF